MTFPRTRALLETAARAGAFPAAAIEVGRRDAILWQHAAGRLTTTPTAADAALDTVFDLASLTKVIATASIAMRLVAEDRLRLDAPLHERLEGWSRGERRRVRLEDLLRHTSGLPAHARLWDTTRDRAGYEAAIAALPLERQPGTAAVYSDLGFILLGFILEDEGRAPLDDQFRAIEELDHPALLFRPSVELLDRVAPTEFDPGRGRLLRGEVHDENAAALGGVAGHAGLFGTAPAVGRFARMVLSTFQEPTALGTPAMMRRFSARSGDLAGSSRALAWDTMLPTSSCGGSFSPSAIGHTGFTGTSLWIDPERDLYVTLLTNRVHPTRANEALIALRPRIHDAVSADLLGSA